MHVNYKQKISIYLKVKFHLQLFFALSQPHVLLLLFRVTSHAIVPRIRFSPEAVLIPQTIATPLSSQGKEKKKLPQLHSCTIWLKANTCTSSYWGFIWDRKVETNKEKGDKDWASFLEIPITYIAFLLEDMQVKLDIVSEPAQLLAQYSFTSVTDFGKSSTLA